MTHREEAWNALRPHIWDTQRDVCIACGRSRRDIVDQQIGVCGGTVVTREWLKGMRWVREPVIPTGERTDG